MILKMISMSTLVLIFGSIIVINVAENKIDKPNGRCDRRWLPYMEIKSSSSQIKKEFVINLKELASSTNAQARIDFVTATLLSTNVNSKNNNAILKHLNTNKIKVQSTFDNIAIAIKLEKQCSLYIKKSSYMYVYISTLYCCIRKQCWRCGMYRLKRSQLCYDEERNNNKMMNLLIISIIFQ